MKEQEIMQRGCVKRRRSEDEPNEDEDELKLNKKC
jgi:hypothetical protein